MSDKTPTPAERTAALVAASAKARDQLAAAANIDPKLRAALAKAAACKPDEIISHAVRGDVTTVVVHTATSVSKVEVPTPKAA